MNVRSIAVQVICSANWRLSTAWNPSHGPNTPHFRPTNPSQALQVVPGRPADNISSPWTDTISRRTGYTKEDLDQIAMLGFMQAARRFSPDHGDFRPFGRSNANDDVYHYLRDKGFLIKVSASWRELHARWQKPQHLGAPPAEIPGHIRLQGSLEVIMASPGWQD